MKLPTIPADKANHYFYGGQVGMVAAITSALLGHPETAGLFANLAALAAGCVKELIDWLANRAAVAAGLPAPHTVDPNDVLATWLGGLQVQAVLAGVDP